MRKCTAPVKSGSPREAVPRFMNIDYAPGRRAPAPLICGRSLLALGLVMGKKSRAVPGRRPILQLSPPGPRSSTPGRDPDPDPDPEADSAAAAAATSQPAPAAATAAAATSPAVPATAAPEDSPSEGKGAREGPSLYLGRPKLEHGACGLGSQVSVPTRLRRKPWGRGTPGLLRSGARQTSALDSGRRKAGPGLI